jgi:hypothetical protein
LSKFQLLAKSSANVWVSIGMIYPELDTEDYRYETKLEASRVKGRIKQYLKHYKPRDKVPIKIIELF